MKKPKKIRIAILDQNGSFQGFIDNYIPGSAKFYDDQLHEYLEGSTSSFSFSALTTHPDHKYLTVGNKLSFSYNNKDYYFNIQRVEQSEKYIYVESYSSSFELLNEQSKRR